MSSNAERDNIGRNGMPPSHSQAGKGPLSETGVLNILEILFEIRRSFQRKTEMIEEVQKKLEGTPRAVVFRGVSKFFRMLFPPNP